MAKKQKAPAFQLYARDFLSDEVVSLMSLEEEGAYIHLLCHQWVEGSIPSDLASISRLCRTTPQRMGHIWKVLGQCFPPHPDRDDRLANPRLNEQREAYESFVESAREAGRKGGRPKAGEERVAFSDPSEIKSSAVCCLPSATAKEYSADFLQAWAEYPNRVGGSDKKGAWKAWRARIVAGHTPDAMTAGVKRYAKFCFDTGKLGTEFVKDARTFFGPSEHFTNEWTSPDPASKYKGGAVGSESEVARAKEHEPTTPMPRSGLSKIAGTASESSKNEDRRRVDEWTAGNIEEARRLSAECKATTDVMFDGMNESAKARMSEESYRLRVLTEKLTPKIAEVA